MSFVSLNSEDDNNNDAEYWNNLDLLIVIDNVWVDLFKLLQIVLKSKIPDNLKKTCKII